MKQRTTFIHQPEDAFTPDQLHVSTDSLSIKALKGAREDRWTLGVNELPEEVH